MKQRLRKLLWKRKKRARSGLRSHTLQRARSLTRRILRSNSKLGTRKRHRRLSCPTSGRGMKMQILCMQMLLDWWTRMAPCSTSLIASWTRNYSRSQTKLRYYFQFHLTSSHLTGVDLCWSRWEFCKICATSHLTKWSNRSCQSSQNASLLEPMLKTQRK